MSGDAPLFPILARSDLDGRQRGLWDEITLGPRGFYVGGAEAKALPTLYNAWLQFPELGQLMLALATEIRKREELPERLREMAILTTCARLGCQVEFAFHAPFARNHGLNDAVIAAIGDLADPPFEDATERLVHACNLALLRSGTLSPELRAEIVSAIGLPGLMQLVAVIGLYMVVSQTSNLAAVSLPEDFAVDPQALQKFFSKPEEA